MPFHLNTEQILHRQEQDRVHKVSSEKAITRNLACMSPICQHLLVLLLLNGIIITHTSGLRNFHINRLRAIKRCAFWPTESLYFPVKKRLRYKATSGQHSLRKTPLPCHEAYSAGAWSALMRMRMSCMHILFALAFMVRPGALGSPQLRKKKN